MTGPWYKKVAKRPEVNDREGGRRSTPGLQSYRMRPERLRNTKLVIRMVCSLKPRHHPCYIEYSLNLKVPAIHNKSIVRKQLNCFYMLLNLSSSIGLIRMAVLFRGFSRASDCLPSLLRQWLFYSAPGAAWVLFLG